MGRQGEVLLLEILILSGAPIPFAHHHAGVETVKLLKPVGKDQALALIIEVDVLVCHDV